MKCGERNAISPGMTNGFALRVPNHVSQLRGACPNAVRVVLQIALLLPLVASNVQIRVRRGKGLRDSGRRLAGYPQELGEVTLPGGGMPVLSTRSHISPRMTERGNEPDRVLAMHACEVRKKLKGTTTLFEPMAQNTTGATLLQREPSAVNIATPTAREAI